MESVDKLKKLNGDYYIITDQIIRKDDYYYDPTTDEIQQKLSDIQCLIDLNRSKVTHSTKNLEGVKKLDIVEIEELLYGYSPEKISSISETYKELVKDKLFSAEDMRRELSTIAIEMASKDGALTSHSPSLIYHWIENKIKLLCPNEWNIKLENDIIILI